MNTNKITGLALAISPVAAIIIWLIGGLALLGGVGPDNPQKYIAEMGENSTAIKYLFPLATLLFLIAIGALGYIKKSMGGGPGSYIAGFAWFLIILGTAGQLGETAFTLALAEASNNAAVAGAAVAVATAGGDPVAAAIAVATASTYSAVASSMFAGAQAIGAVATAFSMLGFVLFGLAIWQQKNFSPIVACLMAVSGIFTLVMCLIDYESQLIAIGYIGVVVSFVWLGVTLLTKKD